MLTTITQVYLPDVSTSCPRPLFLVSVSAGFPSPADDYLEGQLDLNRHLIKHEAATFFVRVTGDSMIGSGIHSGDLLIVDRALEPTEKSVVIAVVNGELTVKRMQKRGGHLVLMPDNGNYEPLPITAWTDFEIWGVVTHVIHAV
jgi:DNA polymerase V